MKAMKIAGLFVVLLVVAVVVAMACLPGRMTGGGSVFIYDNTLGDVEVNGGIDGTRVTHGFEIHCGTPDNPPGPNNLEINWKDEDGNSQRFHLENLSYGYCSLVNDPRPPAAGFNTFDGIGTGKLNGVDGAKIVFTFTDSGEPGIDDTEKIVIMDADDITVLDVPTTPVTYGNQQAHKYNK